MSPILPNMSVKTALHRSILTPSPSPRVWGGKAAIRGHRPVLTPTLTSRLAVTGWGQAGTAGDVRKCH